MKNKIEIIDDFLFPEICDYLINYYENNIFRTNTHTVNNGKSININITKIHEFDSLINKLNNHVYTQECQIDWIQIVKWKDGCSQDLHLDTSSDKTVYSSIVYLNNNYKGGQTFFEEGLVITPLKGRALFFNGIYYKHGVMPVEKGPRYTLATWYKKNN